MKINAAGELELEVADERALNKWLSYGRIHNKKLQIDNPVVEKVLEKFSDEDWMKVYSLLRQVYWRYFTEEKDFLDAIENNLDRSNDIDQLCKLLNEESIFNELENNSDQLNNEGQLTG